MASFTDQIQQFNPYISQLPVDEMKQVGMYKQQQYDQGIQKIQGYVDNIAGMDVMRDIDKQYLQSSLNQLGSKLKTVAAGDFSNHQLVNSVGGMASSIVKDPNIQSAVYSTQKIRKGQSDMETAKKAGKSAPSNEWLFNQGVNQYLNNGDIKASFNGGYDQYTNWKKNGLDAIKQLTGDSSITDDAFTTQMVNGKPQLVISDAIVRKKLAGISPEKIQTALMATLSPADFKQMQTDSLYNYSNQDGEQFKGTINSTYDNKVKFYSDQKTILENAISSTTSSIEKLKLNQQITSLDKVIGNFEKERGGLIDAINGGNVDAAKAQFGTAHSIDEFSRAFSHTETSNTYESSPLADMAMKRDIHNEQIRQFELNFNQHASEFALDYQLKKEKLDLDKKAAEGYGGLPSTVDQSLLPEYNLAKVNNDIVTGNATLKTDEATFLSQQGKDTAWLDQQRAAWEKSPSAVDAKVANYFNTTAAKQRTLDANLKMVNEITQKAKEKFGDIYSLIPKDAPAVNVHYSTGTLTLNPKDFVDWNALYSKYIHTGSQLVDGSVPALVYENEKAKKELSPKQYYLYELSKKDRTQMPKEQQLIKDNLDFYRINVNNPYKQKFDDITKYTGEEITKRLTSNQGVDYAIPTANAAQKSSISTLLTQFANQAESQKGGIANSPDFNVSDARKIATDSEARFTMKVVEGSETQAPIYQMTATGKDGKVVKWNVTPEQKMSVFGQDFEASPAVQAIRPYQEQIRKMGGYSTSLGKPGEPSNHNNAFMSKVDFPSVGTYGIKANLEEVSSGKYSIRLSVYDPETKTWHDDLPFPRANLITQEQIAPSLSGLNDAALYEYIHEKSATAEDLKKLKEASKKPL